MVKYRYEIRGGGQNWNEVTKMEGKIDILHTWTRLMPQVLRGVCCARITAMLKTWQNDDLDW